MDNKSISIKDLDYSYGEKKVLKDITIDFHKGNFYSIIGPNGSGKTTLLKNISGLLRGNKDSIKINNINIEKYKIKDLAKEVSSVQQNIFLDLEFSAYDIVMMGRAPYKGRFSEDFEEDRIIVREAMERTETWNLKDRNINALSGGEQQRVIAARAIAQKTKIILLDEPVSHMDIHHQYELLKVMKSIKEEVTVVAVLHDINLAALFSDYIIIMKDGKIEDFGRVREVITKENIKRVYNLNVEVIEDAINKVPHIIPIGI